MGDFGIKISKAGEDVNASSLDNTYLDSRYSSLMLLSKQTVTFTAEEGQTTPSGTEVYTHNLGYCPLAIGFLDYSSIFVSGSNQILPYGYTDAGFGTYISHSIGLTSKVNTIEVDWLTDSYLSGESYALDFDVNYTVTLHIYGFKLGYET